MNNGGKSFSITENAALAALNPNTGTVDCPTDFLLIQDGTDPAQANPAPQDRYCGTSLNPDTTAAVQSTVCSK